MARKEGPWAPLFFLVVCLWLPLVGNAQNEVERSKLTRCASIKAAAERLACFEGLAKAPDADAADDQTPDDAATADNAPSNKTAAEPTLGEEQLKRKSREERRPESRAVVKEVWKGGNRLLYFQFDNGQVWRQMESGYFFYPRDAEFDVRIRQGMMGDYQMRAEGRGRMTRIVRIK